MRRAAPWTTSPGASRPATMTIRKARQTRSAGMAGAAARVHDDVLADDRIRMQELTRDLDARATTDTLTGLHNRLYFDQTLASEMVRFERYGTPLSLILYDIDHFKRVNDTYGHLAGDKVLVQLARFVPNLMRKTDVLARWGGEEFIVLAPGSGGPMAFRAAEKLRDAVGQVTFEDVGTVTCSFGVAQWAPGESATEFIARADQALYQAKASGRNQVVLAPQSDTIDAGMSPGAGACVRCRQSCTPGYDHAATLGQRGVHSPRWGAAVLL